MSGLFIEISQASMYEDFDLMARADVLLVGNSSFSMFAGLLGDPICIYNPKHVYKVETSPHYWASEVPIIQEAVLRRIRLRQLAKIV